MITWNISYSRNVNYDSIMFTVFIVYVHYSIIIETGTNLVVENPNAWIKKDSTVTE